MFYRGRDYEVMFKIGKFGIFEKLEKIILKFKKYEIFQFFKDFSFYENIKKQIITKNIENLSIMQQKSGGYGDRAVKQLGMDYNEYNTIPLSFCNMRLKFCLSAAKLKCTVKMLITYATA